METMEMQMTQGVSRDVSVSETEMENQVTTEVEEGTVEETAPTIDTLLENAQAEGEGFEDILTKIADGEFEQEEGVHEEVEEQVDVVKMEDEEFEEDTMSSEEFIILEEKIDTLMDTTKEVLEKLDQLPKEIRVNAKDFYELILMMYKLAKEEKSKKKRGSLFLFLIKLVGTFMQSIADPEALEKEEVKDNVEESEEPEEGSLIKMMEYLEKNGMLAAA